MNLCAPATCALVCAIVIGCQSEATRSSSKAGTPSDIPATAETQNFSEVLLTESDETDIRNQIERNWNLGSLAGSPSLKDMVAELRIELLPDGTVTKVDVVNDQPGNPEFQNLTDSARRAVMISSPLKLPPGKVFTALRIRFYPGELVQ